MSAAMGDSIACVTLPPSIRRYLQKKFQDRKKKGADVTHVWQLK
jgi:hypothetical protein